MGHLLGCLLLMSRAEHPSHEHGMGDSPLPWGSWRGITSSCCGWRYVTWRSQNQPLRGDAGVMPCPASLGSLSLAVGTRRCPVCSHTRSLPAPPVGTRRHRHAEGSRFCQAACFYLLLPRERACVFLFLVRTVAVQPPAHGVLGACGLPGAAQPALPLGGAF